MKFVPNAVSRKVAMQVLTLKKNSPHIFFGLGVGAVVASTVVACKATLQLEEKLDAAREDINAVKEMGANTVAREINSYDTKTYQRDLLYVYAKHTGEFAKLYGPAIIIGVFGIGCLTGSHVQLHRRNQNLTLALGALSKAYDSYRERVREEIGAEREAEIYRNVHKLDIEDDGGRQVLDVNDPNKYSIYARFFDSHCAEFRKDAEFNRMFLQVQQNFAQQKLASRGHLFLNEVYDMLGMEHSSAGAVVGWIYNGDGDNFVDFGIYEPGNIRFVNNDEYAILLDFNVDGVIYNKI